MKQTCDDEALAVDGTNAELWAARGEIWGETETYDKAQAAYDRFAAGGKFGKVVLEA